MRKYGKWVLTLSLLAATPGMTYAAEPLAKEASPAKGVRATRIDNQRVAESIADALRSKVRGSDIGIEFKNGVATLSGAVSDPKMKALASSLTEKVANVTRVDNRMTVTNKKVAARTKAAADEVVHAGLTNDQHSRERVQQVNATEVQATGPATSAPEATAPGTDYNQQMANQIGAALTEARLSGYDIQIRFVNGVAMLDGSVGNHAERETASKVTKSIPGVQTVTNRLACAEDMAAQRGNPAYRQAYGQPQGQPQAYGQPQGYGQPPIRPAGYMQGPGPTPGYQNGPAMGGGMPMGPGNPPYPPSYGPPGGGASQAVYNSPSMPDHAWPTYAQYPNSAAVSYPQQYSASAWPYIGPFYPYPQVPLGWRDATLRWDDGQWNLMFKPRTDRWWWFLNPNNW